MRALSREILGYDRNDDEEELNNEDQKKNLSSKKLNLFDEKEKLKSTLILFNLSSND